MHGAFRIDVSGRDTTGAFATVFDNGAIAGPRNGPRAYARREDRRQPLGHVRPGLGLHRRSKIGGGTSGGSAVELGTGSCRPTKTIRSTARRAGRFPRSRRRRSLLPGSRACCRPCKSADINAKFKTGDRVEIRCDFAAAEHADPHREARTSRPGCPARASGLDSGHVPEHPHPLQLLSATTDDEVHAAAEQFVRKVSGMTKPSKANEDVFEKAIDEIVRRDEATSCRSS